MTRPMTMVKQYTVREQRGGGSFSPQKLHQATLSGSNRAFVEGIKGILQADIVEVCSNPKKYNIWEVCGNWQFLGMV